LQIPRDLSRSIQPTNKCFGSIEPEEAETSLPSMLTIIFELKKVPAGMAFPYDFGFVPSTEADDGDPVDVLVLMDEPAFPGCVLKCRPIGVIQGQQGGKKNKVRNDRIIAVEKDAHSWADIKTIGDLGKQFVRELKDLG
jgi:inorganic pyrophosphatase